MKRIYYIFLSLLFLIANSSSAQETIFEEKTTIIKSEASFGIGAHTNGYMLTYRFGDYTTATTKRIFEFEIANIKHPREIRSVYPFDDDVRGYVFGKQNNFYAIRPSIGFHKILFPKQSIRGVSIGYVTQIGPSLGIAKPVYLNIIEFNDRGVSNIVVRKFDPDEHTPGNIYGRASFFNGFSEIKFYPGVFGKFGLHFDYGQDREILRAIEVGLKVDAYFSRVPILAFTTNKIIYPNLYIAIFFGNKELN